MASKPRPSAKDPLTLYFEILRSSDPDEVLLARLDEVEARLNKPADREAAREPVDA